MAAGRTRRQAWWWAAALSSVALSPPVYSQTGRLPPSRSHAGSNAPHTAAAEPAAPRELEARLAEVTRERDALQQRVQERTEALYRVSRTGMLPVAGGLDALLQHASRINRLERIVSTDLSRLSQLQKRTRSLRTQLRHSRARADLPSVRENSGRPPSRRTHADFQAAFRSGSPAPPQRGDRLAYGLSVVDGLPTHRFVEQRGELALPLSGPTRIQTATRDESDGPGLELEGQPGSPVRAVAHGRVAFADRYGSYGRIVIVDHGERWYSVYAGLGQSEVRVGDELSRSARIGVLGDAPLYFEVRKGTRNQDPRSWLGL